MHPSQQAEQHTLVSHPVATTIPREFSTGDASNDALFGIYSDLHLSRERLLLLLYANRGLLLTQDEESELIALDIEYRRVRRILERIASGRQDQAHASAIRCMMKRQNVTRQEDLQGSLPEAVTDKRLRLYSRSVVLVAAIEFIIGDLASYLVGSSPNQTA
ncbi:hypothetical protein [Halomonas heilongjiangensis]|uniref:Uncharacterized protein n=1 Tax=Halomonas heilongjiangensis TaxID=1387883 RepID=A0A2N7TU34_9GAMM|nr:hypothetical protein [Halomonas heilongjiangensis]PMR71702.1 hypothetical protein C1H66_01305 [Halomonas heilongjiangensis]PXX89421.1 hypothetical protein CR158_10745 [Halomonas heilongjiangensis]